MEDKLSYEQWIKKMFSSEDEDTLERIKHYHVVQNTYAIYISSKKEEISKEFPKSAEYVRTHLVRPLRSCNRCGSVVLESDLEEYPYQCMYCDEDLYELETQNSYKKDIDDFDYCDLIEQVAGTLCLD